MHPRFIQIASIQIASFGLCALLGLGNTALARPASGTQPSEQQIAAARAAVAARDGAPAAARRAPNANDNQICVQSAVEVRATPFWTWEGFWDTGYDTLELGKTYKLPNGAYTNTLFCQCFKDHRVWGDNWRVAFGLPTDPLGLKGKNSDSFSMGDKGRGASMLVRYDKAGKTSVAAGACPAR